MLKHGPDGSRGSAHFGQSTPFALEGDSKRFHRYPVTVDFLEIPRDPSTFSEGDWRHCSVGLEGLKEFTITCLYACVSFMA